MVRLIDVSTKSLAGAISVEPYVRVATGEACDATGSGRVHRRAVVRSMTAMTAMSPVRAEAALRSRPTLAGTQGESLSKIAAAIASEWTASRPLSEE